MSLAKPLVILIIVILIAVASFWYTARDNDRQSERASVDSPQY